MGLVVKLVRLTMKTARQGSKVTIPFTRPGVTYYEELSIADKVALMMLLD